MNIDLALVRHTLLALEEVGFDRDVGVEQLGLNDVAGTALSLHANWMLDEGLIRGKVISNFDTADVLITAISFAGMRWLEEVRGERGWLDFLKKQGFHEGVGVATNVAAQAMSKFL